MAPESAPHPALLLIADPDLPSAVRLVRLEDKLIELLIPLLESELISDELRALGLHQEFLQLGGYLVAEQRRRTDVTGDVRPVAVHVEAEA